jgi:hypothetical protein
MVRQLNNELKKDVDGSDCSLIANDDQQDANILAHL